ncbi:Hypothetical predicted protein [Olea europaea subsp. europaea]|uniref:AD domain-containing protein n=1 Tax=Olea europaea subsp. europaea TaxID=158383 RepID=A0A8S0P927_OLEEU|nr:Hypothetical predicted protein [Olea europaea subsp. europaea]
MEPHGEDFAVGCILSIKTTLEEEFQAQVIAFDRPSNLLILQEGVKSGSVSKRNIRLLKANYVKEFNFLGRGEDPLDPDKCFLDLNTLQAREDSAIRLPVCWDKTTIVVMNEVRLSPPYLPESVTGGTPPANERVRKVLELERKRLQARNAGE